MTARGRLAAAGAVGLAVMMVSTAAYSHGCDVTDNDRKEASRVIQRVSAEINEMEGMIVEALRLGVGQLSLYQTQSTKALVQALDAQTKLGAQTAREVEESRSQRSRRPSRSRCRTITGLRGLRAGREAASEAAVRGGTEDTGRISGDRGYVAAPGSSSDSVDRFATVTGQFCNGERAGAGGSVCNGSAELHGADLNPVNLFERRTLNAGIEQRVAGEVARNLAAPVVFNPVAWARANTASEKRRALLEHAAEARAALASDYFSHLRGLREPAVALGAWAEAVAPGVVPRGDAISRYELLEVLSSGQFEDTNWFVRLQGLSSANLLREMATMQAVGLVLSWERFRLEERRGAIEATRLAAEIEASRDRRQ